MKHPGYLRYEAAQSAPPPDKLAKLADLFGVTTDYLLGREPEVPTYTVEQMLKDVPVMLRLECEKEFQRAIEAAGRDEDKLRAIVAGLKKL